MKIQVLSDETINQIAAGEVIERPLSIVKELLENAVDAGAHAVSIEIRNGGLSMIRITDNGCGIEKDQVRTAFLRHATSKITDAKDLEHIATLGFRGEALASIAAVAKVELITKQQEALFATHYTIEGGVEKEISEVGAPDGTTMIVRDLFYNVPARKKFLKSAVTEASRIQDIIEKEALAHPEVAFRYLQDGKQRLATLGNGSLLDVIYAVFGRDIANQLITVKKSYLPSKLTGIPAISIRGFLGKPVTNRSNRNFEIYFVNKRFVKNPLIQKAIEDGYRAFLMQHKFPFAVLMIDVNPEIVDVNVHPQKLEVRFSDGMTIYNCLVDALSRALHETELIVNVDLEPDGNVGGRGSRAVSGNAAALENEAASGNMAAAHLGNKPMQTAAVSGETAAPSMAAAAEKSAGQQPAEEKKTVQTLPRLEPFEHRREAAAVKQYEAALHAVLHPAAKPKEDVIVSEPDESSSAATTGDAPAAEKLYLSANDAKSEGLYIEKKTEAAEKLKAGTAGLSEKTTGYTVKRKDDVSAAESEIASETNPQKSEKEADMPAVPENAATEELKKKPEAEEKPITGEQETLFSEKFLTEKAKTQHRIIGQLFETYWLIEYGDKLYIIDQHAAHEKVNFERMMKRLKQKKPASQYLNPPILLALSGEEALMLEKYQQYFAHLGYEISSMGGRDYSISAVPTDLPEIGKKDLLLEILDDLTDETGMTTADSIYYKIASMSCKAAVKGNNRLSVMEADALITELLSLDNPYACPHGRPTIISMSKYELEKKFKRIV